jgi:formate dehydrogenase iron-sulfur subunit
MKQKGMLVDVSKCIACRSCQIACKQWWKLPAMITINRGTHENPPDLTFGTWNRIQFKEIENNGKKKWLFTRKACMHCSKAVCVWVCPAYARTYSHLGHVTIDKERCIGCGRCGEYCPFDVPKLGQHGVSPRFPVKLGPPRLVSYSCIFCIDRLEDGLTPACAKTCPTEAIRVGDLDDLVVLGQARVNELKTSHPKANIYGKKELGGLKVVYVLTEEPGIHGLPENPQIGTYPEFVKSTFPRWYTLAVTEGKLPVFPQGARREWYMQGGLTPAPSPKEPAWAAEFPGSKLGRWAPLLWGWLGIGIVGGAATLGWSIRRRNKLGQEKQKDGES